MRAHFNRLIRSMLCHIMNRNIMPCRSPEQFTSTSTFILWTESKTHNFNQHLSEKKGAITAYHHGYHSLTNTFNFVDLSARSSKHFSDWLCTYSYVRATEEVRTIKDPRGPVPVVHVQGVLIRQSFAWDHKLRVIVNVLTPSIDVVGRNVVTLIIYENALFIQKSSTVFMGGANNITGYWICSYDDQRI